MVKKGESSCGSCDHCRAWDSRAGWPTKLINMSAAVLSLIEIILVAASRTDTFVPVGTN